MSRFWRNCYAKVIFKVFIPPTLSADLAEQNVIKILLNMLHAIIKSRRMRWAGHVARMGRRGTLIDHWWESQRERGHYEDQDVSGWIILGWILERWDGVMWTGLVWLRIGTGGELL
jgi:hypothetical protein